MHIPYSGDLAILFLAELLLSGRDPVPISDFSAKHSASPLFLKKIARQLRQAGLIRSKEGAGGGYVLGRNPDSVTIWDVYVALDQKRHADSMHYDSVYLECPLNSACLPQIVRKKVRVTLKKSLESVTIASLIKNIQI